MKQDAKNDHKRDSLNRRNRFAGRQPTGKRVILTERDLVMFAALERHGPLPSTYLFEFAKDHARNMKGHLNRLTDLYNEHNTEHRAYYLDRPEQQFASLNARYQPMIYENTPYAEKALREHGIPKQMLQGPNGPYLHRFMTASITASIELAVRTKGYRYLSQADIFAHPKCPLSKDAKNPLALRAGDTTIIPDQLFGIDYGGSYRFFVLEADRQTETLASTKPRVKSFKKKLEAYATVLRTEEYKRVWGIPQLYVLTVTTSEERMRAMMEIVRGMEDEVVQARIAFQAIPAGLEPGQTSAESNRLFFAAWARAIGPLMPFAS